ncbi:2-oxo-4-hydroxy-4-carboxy-5-ureidoimidazoline decarboxylase [Vibrio sp. RC27]
MMATTYPLILDTTELMNICSSSTWIARMKESMPFDNFAHFEALAESTFNSLSDDDWLQAFAGHPMIGDLSTLHQKYKTSKALSAQEQGLVEQASDSTLRALLQYNHAYLDKFGFIFIVCASGKSAEEMLMILKARFLRSKQEELIQAAFEQRKISKIRMEAYL